MNAATQVFNIPELLELILLSLPADTTHKEITSMRSIHTLQTISPTWHKLIQDSTPLRQRLYLSTPGDIDDALAWNTPSSFPPAQPNPWIPHLILNQRSWGSAWPFDVPYPGSLHVGPEPEEPHYWTFSLELSRTQFERCPRAGAWRELLACSPPFTDIWYTRAFYELGSGRAPFVTHLDYDPRKPKAEQEYRAHCPEGVKLGDLVDAYGELFSKHTDAKFVMVENVRSVSSSNTKVELEEDRPRTKLHMPGLSADEELIWR